MSRALWLLLVPTLLSGCVAAAVGAGTETGVSLAEERSLGSKVDDIAIYTDINRLFLREKTNELFASVTINVRLGRVLLTGNVKNQETAARAVLLAWQARSVKEVINEIIVGANTSFTDSATDALIKKNVEGRLLITKGVWVINYSIDVVNGNVYLLGRVYDQAELDRALNVVRTTKGVKRVVNYLQVRSPEEGGPPPVAKAATYNQPAGTPPASSQPAPSYTPPASSAPAQSAPYYTPPADSGGYTPEPVTSVPLPTRPAQ